MDMVILRKYISEYENKFGYIHDREIYKWRAVKQFQDHWNIDAKDFHGMLVRSLSATSNLLEAANYWPKRMIGFVSEKWPEAVRTAFIHLFEKEDDLRERINAFQETINSLSKKLYPNANPFQDHHAILVYLSLRYPDDYFIYKFTVFKDFCKKVDHEYTPQKGRIENIVQFIETCKMVRGEIQDNNHLLKLHKDRLKDTEYFDKEFNILTQDFMYAVTSYLSFDEKRLSKPRPSLRLVDFEFKAGIKQYEFRGKYIDHLDLEKSRKRLGDLGEQWVLQYERDHCAPKYHKQIIQASKTQGDGLGYDIESVNNKSGKKKFIEVKTTTRGRNQSFFITETELRRSKQEGENYFLYRLFNFNEKTMTADYFILQGDLSKYCINPTGYEVVIKAK